MTAKAPPKAKTRKAKAPDVELEPDAWERFERTVDKAVVRPSPAPEVTDDDVPELDEAWFAKARPAREVLGDEFMEKVGRKPEKPPRSR
jgi:hypothetical protein